MEKLIFGLTVTGIGMAIVFAGLVILICLIKLVNLFTGSRNEKKKIAFENTPAPADQIDSQTMAVIAAAVAAQDQELIAVISAAVAAVMGDGANFTVRRIRRISNASAWQKAGREEQIYSRF